MIRFIKKVSIGCAILVTLFCLTEWMYIHTDYYKNLNDMGKFNQVPEHIDIANFGASHSTLAFSWDAYKEEFTGFNMALGSQTLEYDEAIFNTYYDRFDRNSIIVFEIMYKSLYEYEPQNRPYSSSITRYYKILSKENFPLWNFEDAVAYQYLPIIGNRHDALQNILKEYIIKTIKNKQNDESQNSNASLSKNPTKVLEGFTKESMDAEGYRRAQSFIALCGEQELNQQYDALIRMIKRCKEKGMNVILVTAPTLPCFYEGYPTEFTDKFYKDIDMICETYDVPYIDYTGDERLLVDYRWYRDTDHLNESGSKIFMKYFMQDNQELLRLSSEKE